MSVKPAVIEVSGIAIIAMSAPSALLYHVNGVVKNRLIYLMIGGMKARGNLIPAVLTLITVI